MARRTHIPGGEPGAPGGGCRAGAAAAGASRAPLGPGPAGSGGTLLRAAPAAWHRVLRRPRRSLLFPLCSSLSLPLAPRGGRLGGFFFVFLCFLFFSFLPSFPPSFFPPRSGFPKGPAKMLSWKSQLLTPSSAARRGSSFAGCCQRQDWQDPAGLRGRAQPAGGLRAPPGPPRALPAEPRLKCAGSWPAGTAPAAAPRRHAGQRREEIMKNRQI